MAKKAIGRPSGSAIAKMKPVDVKAVRRARVPAHLTDDQGEVWRRTVDALPADWFPAETLPLLEQYCRHVVTARELDLLVEARKAAADPSDPMNMAMLVDDLDKLLKMREREGRAISSLGTRMRITQQSTYSARKGKERESAGRKPWDGE